MDPASSPNRALQRRAMDALRARLPADPFTGLPSADGLSPADQDELCALGAGRLGALAITLPTPLVALARPRPQGRSPVPVRPARAVAALVFACVRRTDLLLMLDPTTLVVLAPGLDPMGGRALHARLADLLGAPATADAPLSGQAPMLGLAYRSPASPAHWDVAWLAREARRRALNLGRGAVPLVRAS